MSPYRAKKRLGQNFLKSQTIIDKIVALVDPNPGERIIEIGPGRGALTMALAKSGADIVAVEFDRDLISYLSKKFESCDNVRIVNEDFLKYEPESGSFKLVGNIPYNITSPVIEWAVDHRSVVDGAYLMVQKEMALRLASSPGSREWCPMAIFTQLHYRIRICFDVAASNFKPPPKVVSSVIELKPQRSRAIENYEAFERLVRQSFEHRRKVIVNNLVPMLTEDKGVVVDALRQLGLSDRVRAEQISSEQFLELTKLLAAHNIFEV